MDGSVNAGKLYLYSNIEKVKYGGKNNYPFYLLLCILGILFLSSQAFGISLDGGEDMSKEFTTAASLLKTFDKIIFGWGSPIVGAIFLFWSTWALVQQKVMMFIIALIAAIFILIVPKFIKDLNSLNDGTIFSNNQNNTQVVVYG
ncbi:MAG: hypothetical protein KDD45_00580 [Bdellovibrionales bacterium]|nr:hypothetical protein [Bdellovibrionales bacterium]